MGTPLATLPSKQGLKQWVLEKLGERAKTSRYTSIKTRIETPLCGVVNAIFVSPLATLPSKQGLKRGLGALILPLAKLLSLHFHQNKD